jgi:hypothetical protein
LPESFVVSSGPRFFHSPAIVKRLARTKPRPVIITNATATSATSSVSTSGVFVTLSPRFLQ